jgi:hypothetical protein
MASRSFSDQAAKQNRLVHQAKGGVAGEVGDLRVDVEAGFTALEAELSQGVAASAVLIQAGQPTTLDTLTIGSDVYEVDGVGSNINFALGADAEGSLDNLLAAAVASGTENLYWDKLSATQLRLRSASDAQGTITGADPSIAIDTSSMTNWSCNAGDVDMNTLAGKAAGETSLSAAVLTITTAMITAGVARISFPFTPTAFTFSAVDATGVPQAFTADTLEIDGDDVVVGLGTDLANTDVLTVVAYA